MMAPTTKPERRQTPRTTVNRLAYINLDSNNGAIVLNISNDGLCFHSVDPVQRNGTIHFWFLDHNHRIEAHGKVAWMDDTQKTGGLQFANLSTEARVQIREWISQPAAPRTAKRAAPLHSSPSEQPINSAAQLNANAVRNSSATLGRSPSSRAPVGLSGFSGGLIFGILISAVVAAAFLLHAYRRELGNSLIQLGERLGARHEVQTVSPASSAITAPAPKVAPLQEKAPKQPPEKTVRPQQATIDPTLAVRVTRAPTITASAIAAAPAIPSQSPPTSLPAPSIEPSASHVSEEAGTAPELGSTRHPGAQAEDSREDDARSLSTKFLEVGKFRDAIWANKTTDKLTQLGFHATVIHRGHLWMNSYQVLVGPYGNEAEAKLAHANLASRGFKPRSYERGSRPLSFSSGLTVNGARLPVGDFVVSWESYVPDAIVKFEKEGTVVGTVEGNWEKRSVKYENDAIVYRKNSDGSRTLLELRFAGMSQALVFGKSS